MKDNYSIKSYLKTAIRSFLAGYFILMFLEHFATLFFSERYIGEQVYEYTLAHVFQALLGLFEEAIIYGVIVMCVVLFIKFIINIINDKKSKVKYKNPDVREMALITIIFILLFALSGIIEKVFIAPAGFTCAGKDICTRIIVAWGFPHVLIWPIVLFYIIVCYKKCFRKKSII